MTKNEKKFFLKAEEIAPVIPGRGGCLATDRIVVDGCKVGYMSRSSPVQSLDTGWCFFAGDESQEYMSDNSNHGVYDLNTIVNYDPDILDYIDFPIGSNFERISETEFAQLYD
jgi:hypothetical protein